MPSRTDPADVSRLLIRHGHQHLVQPFRPVPFVSNPEANALLNDIAENPHAFVLASVMDRQIPTSRAQLIPHTVMTRLGMRSFRFDELKAVPLDRFERVFSAPPKLHRFRGMARYFHSTIRRIDSDYGGDASAIWSGSPSSACVVRRFLEFDGVGIKIATMAANILVREFKIPVSDKASIDISPDVQVRRVFRRLGLIREDASNEELIYRARELNPEYPGVFDLPAWEIGNMWCKSTRPECERCYMMSVCPEAKRLL